MFKSLIRSISFTSKQNGVGIILVTFGIGLLTDDINSYAGHAYTILGAIVWCLKNAIHKTKDATVKNG